MNKFSEKRKKKLAIHVVDFFLATSESIALPTKTLRNKQEQNIRNAYKTLNKVRTNIGLNPKEYKRINSKGKQEVVM